MKLKVIGWTEHDDTFFEEADVSLADYRVILQDVVAHSYEFNGWCHQESRRGAPVLSDGKIRRFSQRGWGGLMAEAKGMMDPFAYTRYAFGYSGEPGECMPGEERDMHKIMDTLLRDALDAETYGTLLEDFYTVRFPHPELGEDGIYTLTEEEVDSIGLWGTVRQVPYGVYRQLFEVNPYETFVLDEAACTLVPEEQREIDFGGGPVTIVTPRRIRMKFQEEYALLAPGDTVVLGDARYTVKSVEETKDVSEEIQRAVRYRSNENYEQAAAEYIKADTILEIIY